MEILIAAIKAFLGHASKKFLDVVWKPKEKPPQIAVVVTPLLESHELCRSIAGIWVCQYKYPALDDRSGEKKENTETQLVRFEQTGNAVRGTTIFAIAHPEDFQGSVTKDRYFTGLYANKRNHYSYHGAFQFVISQSHNRMVGRWVGFNREGNGVDSEEWRWERWNDSPTISSPQEHDYVARLRDVDLFSIRGFL